LTYVWGQVLIPVICRINYQWTRGSLSRSTKDNFSTVAGETGPQKTTKI